MIEMTERRIEYLKWHLDKRVPIAMIVAILFQTGIFIWLIAKLDSRVEALERTSLSRSTIPDRVTRLEVIVEQLPRTLERIENKLDKKLDKDK